MKKILLLTIISILLISGCKKSKSDDSGSDSTNQKFRIAKVIGPVYNQDSLRFIYFNNKLIQINQYYYLDGEHGRKDQYDYSYNANNSVSKITTRHFGGFLHVDTTYFEYQGTTLAKIIFRSQYYTTQYEVYSTSVVSTISFDNTNISGVQTSYKYKHSWYDGSSMHNDSSQHTMLENYAYSGSNVLTRTLGYQKANTDQVIAYQYDTKSNPFQEFESMPSIAMDRISYTPIDYYMDGLVGLSSNNITKMACGDSSMVYQYEYNAEGLPSKAMITIGGKKASKLMYFEYEAVK